MNTGLCSWVPALAPQRVKGARERAKALGRDDKSA
jgi:hypothetical protein